MATYLKQKEDPMVTCPYNPAHRVSSSRLQIHLTKCKKNHPEKNLETCPFNAEHRVPAEEWQYHVDNCPQRRIVERYLLDDSEFAGNTSVPPYKHDSEPLPVEENWDNEIVPGNQCLELGSFRTEVTEPRFKNVQGMKPAERRKFYQSLHGNLNDNESEKTTESMETPRQPKETSKVLKYLTSQKQTSVPGLSGSMTSSKIAANFGSHANNSSHSDYPVSRILGAGRGYTSAGRTEVPKLLGIGRGRGLPANFHESLDD